MILAFSVLDKSTELKLGDSVLGFIGELSREVINDYDFRSKPCVAELDFNILIDKTNLDGSYCKISSFPIVTRDLAVVADEKVTWADIKGCIESLKIDYLGDIEFFDVYRGKQVEKGKKSIAFKLIFRAEDKTLKSEEVDARCRKKSLQILPTPLELSCVVSGLEKNNYTFSLLIFRPSLN